jgi:hypothetical protein
MIDNDSSRWRHSAHSSKVPLPTMLKRKAAATSVPSWRESQPADAADRKVSGFEEYTLSEQSRELHLVRAAMLDRALFAAAIAEVMHASCGADVDIPTIFELPSPRALAAPTANVPKPKPAVDVGATPPVAPTVADDEDEDAGGMPPAMLLPPSVPSAVLDTHQILVSVVPTAAIADNLRRFVTSKHPEAVVEAVMRPLPSTCTIVVKGIPLSIKHDRLWGELSAMNCPPTYLRFHRNDRGLFKNVVYIKFPSRVKADIGRAELERFSVGGRHLKVEFKKSKASTAEETARAEAARREDVKVLVLSSLEELVRDLAKNNEHDGFLFPRQALSREEQKYLRGLCQASDLLFEVVTSSVVVKKRADKTRASPSLTARTPPFNPATPSLHSEGGPDSGMQFRGIRHWKEQRQQSVASGGQPLGIARPLGPGDSKSFGSGRGKPAS